MEAEKNITFKLNPEWMFKEPIDFEYNKYTLLGYLKKCGESLDNFKIYPDFVELSLHLANLQSLIKENVLLLTNKKFESFDDEILLKELYVKTPRDITTEEKPELDKTLNYSIIKLMDAFNFAKSIWTLAYEKVNISPKRGKNKSVTPVGFVIYQNKNKNILNIWEYQIKRPEEGILTYKFYINSLYEGVNKGVKISSIIENDSTWKDVSFFNKLTIFQVKCEHNLPVEETLIPIMKRKILSYVLQTTKIQNLKTFDKSK